jgi:hypothetical protein
VSFQILPVAILEALAEPSDQRSYELEDAPRLHFP